MSKEKCHFPAQELLSLNEMKEFVRIERLPEDFLQRVKTSLSSKELAESDKVSYMHSSPYSLIDLLSWEEMEDYIHLGDLPEDFVEKVESILKDDVCINCDGVECMGCVCRDWDHECAKDCPSCC